MFLSISIPIYNAENYLDRCLLSIVSQTYQDYEIILVNDGSKDNSLNIIKKWHEKYPDKIRYVDKKNTGSLLTRRVCLQESRGDYVYIMDADDYLIESDALQEIHDTLIENQCDMVFFNATTDDNSTSYYKYPFDNKKIFENDELLKIYYMLASGDEMNSLWNKVFSKKLIDWEFDYTPYAGIKNGTDFFQVIPLILNAKKIVYLNKILYYYQTESNDASIMHKFNPFVYESLKCDFLRLEKELAQRGLLSTKMKSVLDFRYMKISSTAAYKVRMVKHDLGYRVELLRKIGNDIEFRNRFKNGNSNQIGIIRKIINCLLYIRCYRLLAICFF